MPPKGHQYGLRSTDGEISETNLVEGVVENVDDLGFPIEEEITLAHMMKSMVKGFERSTETADRNAQMLHDMLRGLMEQMSTMTKTFVQGSAKEAQAASSVDKGKGVREELGDLGSEAVEMHHAIYVPPPLRLGGSPNTVKKTSFAPSSSRTMEIKDGQIGLHKVIDDVTDMDGLQKLIETKVGEQMGKVSRPSFKNPYPTSIDDNNPYPKDFKWPHFPEFTGEDDDLTTVEHIGKFQVMAGKWATNPFLKMRLFPVP